jgi:endoglucanase
MLVTHISTTKRRIILTTVFSILISFNISYYTYAQANDSAYRIVDRSGQLRVEGLYIFDQNNDTVVLEGMSLFWSQWIDKYYNQDCIRWLRNDWHSEIIRAAMGIENEGYLKNPEREKRKIRQVINSSIELGMYVIIDWHSHSAQNNTEIAKIFFEEIAREYGSYPNIIYEIYNEPLRVSWKSEVKPYCETIIAAIRKYDPDNIIVVGTPSWSQDVDSAADDPILDENVVYSLHFYAGTHEQWLRDKADYAMSKGLPIWVTEFGTCNADGRGPIDYKELTLWFEYMDAHKISWCNWSVADKKETASILLPHANRKGGWAESSLTESGKLIRNKLREKNP